MPLAQAPKVKVARQLVDHRHLRELVAAYGHRFKKDSKMKQGKVTELIPGAVWRDVNKHYRNVFPDSAFSEDTLKENLRLTLRELNPRTLYIREAWTELKEAPTDDFTLYRAAYGDDKMRAAYGDDRRVIFFEGNRIPLSPPWLPR